MSSLRHHLGSLRRRSRVKLFGNNHSLRTNCLYYLYHRSCRRIWERKLRAAPASTVEAGARALHEQGFAVYPPAADLNLVTRIGATIDELFSRLQDTMLLSDGLYRLRDGLEKVPEIVELITPEIEETIEHYFRSHFKIFGVYFYRTIPTEAQPASSFLWHLDNCPRHEIKLMVYLDDTTAATGAFRLKPKPLSNFLKARGFWDRRENDRFGEVLEEECTTVTLEGPAGTCVLFQNGGCIHKGTFPLYKHRDVATFVIIPSSISWRLHFARNRHLLSTNSGICVNPFTDTPQSISYTE